MPVDCQVAESNPPAAVTRTPVQLNAQRCGFPVEIIEDAAGCREMQQVPAGEIGVYRNAAGVHRCGKRTAAAEPDIIVPAPTATSKRVSIINSFPRASRSAA